jgi:nucleoside-diphosphate-sugar epimerase
MTRVLITGGQGFVGANLVRRMLRDGHEAHLLSRTADPGWRLADIAASIHWHRADLRDAAAVGEAVRLAAPQWVFHLAAYGAYSWQTEMRPILETNFLGTVNLVEACAAAKVQRFVHSGSSSEYGFKNYAPAESCWLEPNSYYAVAKASATQFCRYAAQSQGFPAVTLRLYSVFGPYEDPRRLMPSLMIHGLAGGYPPLAAPATARDYVFVDDVVDACCLAAAFPDHEPGAVYNVGTGRQTSLAEVVALTQRMFNICRPPVWGTFLSRAWDTATWQADISCITSKLGWQPRHSLAAGLRRFCDWFREEPSRLAWYRQQMSSLSSAALPASEPNRRRSTDTCSNG